ncbi:iron-siderophore ABC transporter substrate-binding protein [Streptomyces sp. TP-A0874]|uniref:iron-siderophore ABC transporter substrate-binding protein n=1 Tax=Streptomyces sp. TP-A0874 TaxID=549819 RepID=UPI000852D911|nr:iron-siderophore ABC transporter substrate-binding protein [Streptomyces sp. TP-A0874]
MRSILAISRARRSAAPRPLRAPRATAAVLVGALAVLTGCSSSPDTGGEDAGKVDSKGTFPAKVATKFGEVVIKEQPKRVVALGWGDAETALALGVQPVGASDWLEFGGEGVGPWAEGMYDKAPQKIGTLEPEFEKIAALQPDLILDTRSSGDQKRYDNLSKIAPTVGVPKGRDSYRTNWEQQAAMVADALGLHEEGQELIKKTKGEFKAAVKAHPEFKGKTVTSASLTSEGYGAYVRGSGRVDFLERLGFENNPEVEKNPGTNFFTTVSHENIGMFDADLLVLGPIGVPSSKATKDPIFQEIPAVKKGNVVVFQPESELSLAFATDSPLAVSYALEKVVPMFSEALKK